MLQGSVLGHLLLLIYINDLHYAIRFAQSFHFADDLCLLNIQNTISKINRSLNKALKELSFWLYANKITLNIAKTEVILFKTKHKPASDWRLKLCRIRLYKTKYLRYLGIKIDRNLNWKIHIHDLTSKLQRANNTVLAKLRHFVNNKILRSTCFVIFHSHLNYVCIVWGLTRFPQQRVSILQKKH